MLWKHFSTPSIHVLHFPWVDTGTHVDDASEPNVLHGKLIIIARTQTTVAYLVMGVFLNISDILKVIR